MKLVLFGFTCLAACLSIAALSTYYSSEHMTEMRPGETRYIELSTTRSFQATENSLVRRVDLSPKDKHPHKVFRASDGFYLVDAHPPVKIPLPKLN